MKTGVPGVLNPRQIEDGFLRRVVDRAVGLLFTQTFGAQHFLVQAVKYDSYCVLNSPTNVIGPSLASPRVFLLAAGIPIAIGKWT